MRLLTHNLLACHSRHCTQTSNNFPLKFKDVKLELLETDFNEAFIRGFLPKLDWNALIITAKELGDTSLPEKGPDMEDPMLDHQILRNLHHVLLEVSMARWEDQSGLSYNKGGTCITSMLPRRIMSAKSHKFSLHNIIINVEHILIIKTTTSFFTFQVHITEGSMTCPNCSHNYPIRNGIPNMVSMEKEVSRYIALFC